MKIAIFDDISRKAKLTNVSFVGSKVRLTEELK